MRREGRFGIELNICADKRLHITLTVCALLARGRASTRLGSRKELEARKMLEDGDESHFHGVKAGLEPDYLTE
jgi:hypothetical protein